MTVGLYFGSFNPIHIGHMAIANYVVEYSGIDKLWFVVSPHNPLKNKKTLLNDYTRLEMVEAAINGDTRFHAIDIEFRMPQPSYTIDTLAYLEEKYPKHNFILLMGSDGLRTFHKWKNHQEIINKYTRIIFPRHTEEIPDIEKHKNIEIINAPRFEISSSFIRKAIKENRDIRHFLPYKVFKFIDKGGYYS